MTDNNSSPLLSAIPLPTGLVTREANLTSEPFDPSPSPNFFVQIGLLITNALKALPKRLKKDAIWLIPLAILWVFLWTIKPMPLMSLPSAVQNLVHVLIFLTATYNGFLGKAVFVTVVGRTIIPAFNAIRQGKLTEVKSRYVRVIGIIRRAAAASRQTALPILLIGIGSALAVSNLLTRNNRIDKYFVCVLAAAGLIDDLSHGAGSPVVRLILSGLRDIPRLFGKKSAPTMQLAYLLTGGFALGLILAFIPGLLNNSYTSPSGLYLGLLVAAAGFILLVVRKKPVQPTPGPSTESNTGAIPPQGD